MITTTTSNATSESAPAGLTAAGHGYRGFLESGDWWQDKVTGYRAFMRAPVVEVNDAANLTPAEHAAISARLDAANMALYRVTGGGSMDHAGVLSLGRQFGLHDLERNLCADEDAVSDITACDDTSRRRYIPYTTRSLSWHTDGYYNPADRCVRAFVLHCVTPAYQGGENQFIDHEMLFGLLSRDANVRTEALFLPGAFSIPANIDDGATVRERFEGPVFSYAPQGGLHMRFSARQRNIEWSRDPEVLTAVEAIRYYLNNSEFVLRRRLEPGMGIITRNVLHRRSEFIDARGEKRLFLRARYHDCVSDSVLTGHRHDLA